MQVKIIYKVISNPTVLKLFKNEFTMYLRLENLGYVSNCCYLERAPALLYAAI